MSDWPQVIMGVMLALNAVLGVVLNGEPKTGTHNGAIIVLGAVGTALVLHWGGFWQ